MARRDALFGDTESRHPRDPIAIGFCCCYLIFACERARLSVPAMV
jgi:hypothetical protein